MTRGELLEFLTKEAIKFRKKPNFISINKHLTGLDVNNMPSKEQIDGVLVAFINSIGMSQCIDYALSYKDFEEKRETTMVQEEYPIKNKCFEFNEKTYDCTSAIERDIKMILQEAATSHKDSFDELYDRQSLKADKVRIFLDEKGNPIFGMIIYLIEYKDGSWERYACGGYYPFRDDILFPHPYQESICW